MVGRLEDARDLRRRLGSEAGFSLMELMVAGVISLIVVGGAVTLAKQVQQGYGRQLDTASAEQEGRYALDWIQRLLRQAGSDPYSIRTAAQPCLPAGLTPSVNGFPPVMRDPNGNNIDDDIRIFADANPPNALVGGPGPAPGGCTEAGEDFTVTHVAANRVITLRDNDQFPATTQVMTDDVITSLRFAYADRNGVATTNMANLAWVTVTVVSRSEMRDPHTNQFPTYTVSVNVRLRPRW